MKKLKIEQWAEKKNVSYYKTNFSYQQGLCDNKSDAAQIMLCKIFA